MQTDTRCYRLKFKTQLHLGRASGAAQRGNLGLEKTETYIPADTLFSALCHTWASFYDTESLTAFLNRYSEDTPVLPFTLTSAFPFADSIYFYPKPLTFRVKSKNSKLIKKSKRVQFVSDTIFRDILSGNHPDFTAEHLINADKVWVNPEEKARLQVLLTPKAPLKKFIEEPLAIWETAIRPRVTLGSQNAGSKIWHVQTVEFNTDCGLWFAARFDSEETRQRIEPLLRVLGDTGIGGERNVGYGMFNFSPAPPIALPTAEVGAPFVTLSPICPKSPVQLEQLLAGNTIAYTLRSLPGWVNSTGPAFRRKQVSLFTEGSILHTSDTRIGRLVDLRPDNYEHPVYRYGYAWQVGITGVSE